MNIEQSQAVKLRITDIESLDPITVFLEDFGPGRGKITIECFGESWSSAWAAMGGGAVADFFIGCDEHYLAKKLSSIKSGVPDYAALEQKAVKEILSLRRAYELDSDKARELYDEFKCASLDDSDGEWWCRENSEYLSDVFGDDWWYSIPEKPNHEYEYLCRIIKTVQAALKESGLSQPKVVNIETVKGDLNINL